uniref:WW domain-containing protein n=1 Tax=Haemonchus placei TaxID=6290 RepID=A0A0N4VYY5_HAEPC
LSMQQRLLAMLQTEVPQPWRLVQIPSQPNAKPYV